MAYVKKVNIKGQDYWYLFHTIRQSNKFLKKSRYLGKELPKNLEEIKQEFLNELHAPKEKSEKEKLIESLTPSERKVFPILKEENELSKIAEISRLQQIEVLRALGWLEAKNLIKINKEEKFLKKLPLELLKLNKEDKLIYNELGSRKEIIKTDVKKTIYAGLTDLGKELINHKLKTNLIESLNQEMLLKKSWKNKTFRRFNIQSEIPRIYPGRRHFVNEAINYIRKIWLELGFKEMTGNLVQTSFWNFDALFVPQDHPAKDMQDTLYIDGKGIISNPKIVAAVKK